MTDSSEVPDQSENEEDRVDRRAILGLAGSLTAAASGRPAQAQTPDVQRGNTDGAASATVRIRAALPGYRSYSDSFSNRYFGEENIVQTVKRLKQAGFSKENLKWGEYQKYAPDNPEDQSSWDVTNSNKHRKLFRNWESAVAEAREDLRKQPAYLLTHGPDPDSTDKAQNLLDHLDKAVRVALFSKHRKDSSHDSGIPIHVSVNYSTNPYRRHQLSINWVPTSPAIQNPKYKHERLEIQMICPNGGWVGSASWDYDNTFGMITRYSVTYKVPDEPPADEEQVLFLFNGLESFPSSAAGAARPAAILQPVLQWTPSTKDPRTGSWNGWAVRSWYVPVTEVPSFASMPTLNDKKDFTNPTALAYSVAQRVEKNEKIVSSIEWTGSKYKSSVSWTDKQNVTREVAVLEPWKQGEAEILPLQYVVAAIEAYKVKSGWEPFPANNLVRRWKVQEIALQATNNAGTQTDLEPTWDIGVDDPVVPRLKYGTNRLKYYVVQAGYGNDPADTSSELDFRLKRPRALEEP